MDITTHQLVFLVLGAARRVPSSRTSNSIPTEKHLAKTSGAFGRNKPNLAINPNAARSFGRFERCACGNARADDIRAQAGLDRGRRAVGGSITINLGLPGGTREEPEIAAPESEGPAISDRDAGLRRLREDFAA